MSLPASSWTVVVPEKLACNVYIGCMPLRVPAIAPKALPSVLAHLGVQHFYALVQQPTDDAVSNTPNHTLLPYLLTESSFVDENFW